MTDRTNKPRHRAAPKMAHGNEQRSYATQLEIRTSQGDPHKVTLYGNASGTGSYFVHDNGPGGGFNESISWPGALRGTDLSNCKFLTQHMGDPYGSVRGNTLRLSDTPKGMEWELDLDTRSTWHADLLIAVERGDLDRCSIGMVVGRDNWDSAYENRTIHTLSALYDCSLVNAPANENTSVGISDRSAGSEEVARWVARGTNEKRSGKRLSKATKGALTKIMSDHKQGVKKLHQSVASAITGLLLDGDGSIAQGGGQNGGGAGQSQNPMIDGTGSRTDAQQAELRRWLDKEQKKAKRKDAKRMDETIARAHKTVEENRCTPYSNAV